MMSPFVGLGGTQCTLTMAWLIASTVRFLGSDGAINEIHKYDHTTNMTTLKRNTCTRSHVTPNNNNALCVVATLSDIVT